MDENVGSSLPKDILDRLFAYSKSTSLIDALEVLAKISRTAEGRADLASKSVLVMILDLIQGHLEYLNSELLKSSLKLLRNLCAGDVKNQDTFIEKNGVGITLTVLRTVMDTPALDSGAVRIALQVLANVSLAGERHQQTIWVQFFPKEFLMLARIRSQDTVDPLCMILYTCQDGNPIRLAELCGDNGLSLVSEIVRTASIVGFREEWFKLLLSVICLEEAHLPTLFAKLAVAPADDSKDVRMSCDEFSPEQAFLISILSEILNERLNDVTVSNEFALYILGLFRNASGLVDFSERGKLALPTGSSPIDVLGYALTMLRDICAQHGARGPMENAQDATGTLLSSGLLDLLLNLLRELEPPMVISKAINQGQHQGNADSKQLKKCPYKGFRRDIVAVIGNCLYWRRSVQDEVRCKDGIILLMQQCVADEDNPFLREWGIWTVRNLFEGNTENQQAVAELELQETVNTPEIAELGLRVELDQKTGRPKLVNSA
ncbi:ataxin-10 [Eucalyptus grandis]|uniref:ataxin-10 n=1 Tax=Eucalyptus grandis TaxID=71139 RepID=UPI00192E8356|nr:ataxin-10 [Eucalyptus grandis]XP_010025690.2 ataxin-10 [Eucalyptus grandis]XP_039156968.1 ataxin-10 [Eucalyptus grandis]